MKEKKVCCETGKSDVVWVNGLAAEGKSALDIWSCMKGELATNQVLSTQKLPIISFKPGILHMSMYWYETGKRTIDYHLLSQSDGASKEYSSCPSRRNELQPRLAKCGINGEDGNMFNIYTQSGWNYMGGWISHSMGLGCVGDGAKRAQRRPSVGN
jgi:hypothetical protein